MYSDARIVVATLEDDANRCQRKAYHTMVCLSESDCSEMQITVPGRAPDSMGKVGLGVAQRIGDILGVTHIVIRRYHIEVSIDKAFDWDLHGIHKAILSILKEEYPSPDGVSVVDC